jgi:hypothetical protein
MNCDRILKLNVPINKRSFTDRAQKQIILLALPDFLPVF